MSIIFFKGNKTPEIIDYYKKKSESMTKFTSIVSEVIIKDEDGTITEESMGKFRDRLEKYEELMNDLEMI